MFTYDINLGYMCGLDFALAQMFPLFSNVWLQIGFNLISTAPIGYELYEKWVLPSKVSIEELKANYPPSPFEYFKP